MTTIVEAETPGDSPFPLQWSLADVQRHVGNVSAQRLRAFPLRGATPQDALRIKDREGRLFEVIDGILVEKIMGSYESILAGLLVHWIHRHLEQNPNGPRGVALTADGALQILPSRMRIPDVSFIRWEKFPQGRLPQERVYRIAPDLAVEILSQGNTNEEMALKLAEYRQAGVRLIWYIDPENRTATIHTGGQPSAWTTTSVDENGMLDASTVLPESRFVLRDMFDHFG